uniref:F-box domain-containing protein n=1 Tax=Caenorhabditis tropicalis TaxID=1561998 RepID=A0A1I7UX81_9PELO
MHLLDFPLLVQERILRQMDYSEVFLLSLVSKRSTEMVRTVNWKEIETIRYFFQPKQRISVTVIRRRDDSSDEPNCILKIGFLEDKLNAIKTGYIRISEVDVGFRLIKNYPSYEAFVAYYTPEEKDTVVWAISFHLTSIFGKYSKNGLFVSTHTEPLPTYLENTETELFMNCTVEPSFLEDYFSTVPIQDFVEISHLTLENNKKTRIKGESRGDGLNIESTTRPFGVVHGQEFTEISTYNNLDPDSRFYQTSIMHIYGSPLLGTGMLRNFKGTRAFIDDSHINEEDIIEFLNRWKSNEGFQRLRVLYLKTSHQMRRLCHIRVRGGVQYFEVDEIPMEERQCTMYPWALNYQLYVRRVDGAVAYVSIEENDFSFYLQNLIDEESLLTND